MPLENQFPPKFSQNILYPATYNLDTLDMPGGGDYYAGDAYFNVQFPGLGLNTIPTLGYGKHKFDVSYIEYSNEFTVEGYDLGPSVPQLKKGSRILFELKDNNGTIIFSDTIPTNKENGFSGYIWIKQDPLRTYDDIVDGLGNLYIVAKRNTTELNWRNKYNVRIRLPIDIQLFQQNQQIYPNDSPIIFQQGSGSIGSGSGLVVEEVLVEDPADPGNIISTVQISSSRLTTYSGEIKYVTTRMKISGSNGNNEPNWQTLEDYELGGLSYESEIHSDYAAGINPISDIWSHEITEIGNQINGTKVRFGFKFKNPNNETAKDPKVPTSDFQLEYPSTLDEWLVFTGPTEQIGSAGTWQGVWDYVVESTSAGQFSFKHNHISIVKKSGGQKFDPAGNLVEYNVIEEGGAGGGGSRG